MVAPKNGSVMLVVALCAVLGFALACASTMSEPMASEVAQLTDVAVESGDESTVVTLVGLADPIYTAEYDETTQAVVVELASVNAEAAMDRVEIYDGIIDHVSTSTWSEEGGEPITRVEIALGIDAGYSTMLVQDGLAIELSEALAMSEEDELGEGDVADVDPWEDVAVEEVAATDDTDWSEEPVVEETPEDEIGIASPPAATMLASVDVQSLETGALVHLKADGSVWAVESFVLENPTRLVVDLPGIESEAKQDNISVGHAMVKGVRVGAHADKVRVVIDGGEASEGFAGRSVKPTVDGLYVAVGSSDEVQTALMEGIEAGVEAWTAAAVAQQEEAADVAEAEVDETVEDESWSAVEGDPSSEPSEVAAWDEAEPTDEPIAAAGEGEEVAMAEVTPLAPAPASTTSIHGVHYTVMDEMDRIAVLSEAAVDYKLHSPDSDTVVVSLFDATISPQVAGRIRGQSGGPVSLVTIFEQPEVARSEVRVVVTRASDQEPQISRRGALLFIDFEHLGLAAAAPPAFPEKETTGLTVVAAAEGDEAGGMAQPAAADDWSEEATETEVADAASLDELPEFSENAATDGPAGLDEDFDDSAFDMPAEATSDDEFASLDGPLDDFDDFDDFGTEGVSMGGPASLEPPAAVEVLQEGGLTDGKKYAGRRISLDFNNVPIADVLRLIAEVSDLNLIAGDEVKGAVTIRLVDTPWDQALDVVLLTKGLGFVRVGNILRVAPSDILAAEEELRLQERRNREKLEDLTVKLLPVNYAAVKDMQNLVKRLLSSRGTVNIDERTNTLILKDIASVIDEAVALVKAVDTETPQVMIEAKIVEANLNFARELGSSWGLSSQPLVDPFTGTTARDDLGSSDFRLHGTNSIAFSNPITSTPTALADLGAFLLDEKLDLNVALRAAESMGEGKVISSPRVVTLDNGEATIEQGVSIPFQTFEGGDAKLEFIDAVLSLKVIPHITADRSIIMDIEVTRNAPDESVKTPTGSPAIAKAEAATETLVKDGQTLVLGGIYTIDKTERESRVPYLYRLPVIGAAFRSKELTDIRKELLIFVTPRIVKSPTLAASQ
ncbi:MAG: type IV pilus secretin PilQ [Myxococcota bacterium]|jgi:type IV pilus secretin PilQ/predicted competence protein|nr:type IV pilus secretin PilQ [Myxococcota bacterium]